MANQNKNDFDHKKEKLFSPIEMYFILLIVLIVTFAIKRH